MLEPIEAKVPVRHARLERMTAPAPNVQQPLDLFARFSAAVSQLVERLEDPARMLRLARFELEGQLISLHRKMRAAAADLRAARGAEQAEAAAEQGWSDKADVAVAHGRDDLARLAIVERSLAGQRRAAATQAVAALSDATTAIAADAERLRAAIADVWTRQRAVTNRFADGGTAPDECTIDEQLISLKAARQTRAN